MSNAGRVKSLPRIAKSESRSAQKVPEKILKNWEHNAGYLSVTLSKDGKKKKYLVYRLVAQSFIPNPEEKNFVNHIDGDKKNNSVTNLEWTTERENTWHSVYVLKKATTYGIKKVKCLDTGIVYESAAEAERLTGAANQNIIKCCQGKRKHANGLTWSYAEGGEKV